MVLKIERKYNLEFHVKILATNCRKIPGHMKLKQLLNYLIFPQVSPGWISSISSSFILDRLADNSYRS